MNDDKKASCLCPFLCGVSSWRSSFKIDIKKTECCKFHFFQSNGLLKHCQAKGGSYHSCIVYYLKTWISNQVMLGLTNLLLMEITKERMQMKKECMVLSLIERAIMMMKKIMISWQIGIVSVEICLSIVEC